MTTASSPDQLESAILSHLHEGEREESSGCFGRAEVSYRAAFSLAESHSISSPLYARSACSLGEFLRRLMPHTALAEKYLRIAATHALDPVDQAAFALALAGYLLDNSVVDGVEATLQTVSSSDAGTVIRVADARARLLLLQGNKELAGTLMEQNLKAAEELIPKSPEHAEALLHLAEFRKEDWNSEECNVLLMKAIEIAAGHTLISAVRLLAKVLCPGDNPHEATESFKSLLSTLNNRAISPYTRAAVMVEMADAYSWRRANNFAITLYYRALEIYEGHSKCSWNVVWLKMKIDARNSGKRKLRWTKSELDALSAKLPAVSSIVALRSKYTPQRYFLQQYVAKLEVLAERYSECQGHALLTLYSLNGRNGRRIKGIQARMKEYQRVHGNDDAVERLKERYAHFCIRTSRRLNRKRYRNQRLLMLQSLRLPEMQGRFPVEVARTYVQLYHIFKWLSGVPKGVEKTDIGCLQAAERLFLSSIPTSTDAKNALYLLCQAQVSRGLYSAAVESCNKALAILEATGDQSWWAFKDMKLRRIEASTNLEAEQWLHQFANTNLETDAASSATAKAVFYISDLEAKREQMESAQSLLRRYIDRLPRSSLHSAEARFKLGSLCMGSRDFSEALRHCQECLDLLLAIAPNSLLICVAVERMVEAHKRLDTEGAEWVVAVCERLLSQPAASERTAEVLSSVTLFLYQLSTDSLESLLALAPRYSVACFALCCIVLDCYKARTKHAQALALLPLALAEYAHCQNCPREQTTTQSRNHSLSPRDMKEGIEKGTDVSTDWLSPSFRQGEFTVGSYSITQWLAALRECPQLQAPAYTCVEVALASVPCVKDASLVVSLVTYYEKTGRFKDIERMVSMLAHKPNWEYRGRMLWKIRGCYDKPNRVDSKYTRR